MPRSFLVKNRRDSEAKVSRDGSLTSGDVMTQNETVEDSMEATEEIGEGGFTLCIQFFLH